MDYYWREENGRRYKCYPISESGCLIPDSAKCVQNQELDNNAEIRAALMAAWFDAERRVVAISNEHDSPLNPRVSNGALCTMLAVALYKIRNRSD